MKPYQINQMNKAIALRVWLSALYLLPAVSPLLVHAKAVQKTAFVTTTAAMTTTVPADTESHLPPMTTQRAISGQTYLYRAQVGDTPESIAFDFLHNAAKKAVREQFYAHNNIAAKKAARPALLNQVFNIPMDWMYLKPMPATVLKVSGAISVAYYNNGNGSANWQVLKTVGYAIKEGTRIKTGSDGFALLEFPDHSLLSVSPNSTVLLETVRRYAKSDVFNIQVHIENGRVESQVQPLHHPASDYSVKSKRLSTAVRGTRFSVSDSDPTSNAIAEVLEGGVQLSSSNKTSSSLHTQSQSKLIPKGFAAYVKDTQMSDLVALLPAPQWACSAMNQVPSNTPLVLISDKKAQLFKLNIYFGQHQYAHQGINQENKTNQIVTQYRLNQLSPDAQIINAKPSLPIELPEGVYTLQVSAIDENGIHGTPSQQVVTIKNNPNDPEDLFHWQQNSNTRSWALLKVPSNVNNKQLACLD